jgi:hypothetical protein
MVSLWFWETKDSTSTVVYNTTARVFSFIPLINQTINSSWKIDTKPTCISNSWNKTFSSQTTNGTYSNWTLTSEFSSILATINYTGAFASLVGISHLPIEVNNTLVTLQGGPLPVNCSSAALKATVSDGKEAVSIETRTSLGLVFQQTDSLDDDSQLILPSF